MNNGIEEASEMIANPQRYTVEPVDLPRVKEEHREGVFGRFPVIMDETIEKYRMDSAKNSGEVVRFFEHLKEMVDAEEFSAMQRAELTPPKLNYISGLLKYIDPVVWFVSKLSVAWRLDLDKRTGLDILDIGTGPCHWPAVAQFYGHSVLGTDLPSVVTNDRINGHLYDKLAAIYGVRRVPLKIMPFEPLPPMEKRYDLVTALLAAFNVDSEKRPWDVAAWGFFFRDLRDNVLKEGGEVFMSLDNKKLTGEVWAFLKSRSFYYREGNKLIYIKDLSVF